MSVTVWPLGSPVLWAPLVSFCMSAGGATSASTFSPREGRLLKQLQRVLPSCKTCALFTGSGDFPNVQAAHGTNAPPYRQAFWSERWLPASLFGFGGFQKGAWSFDLTAGFGPVQLGVGPGEKLPDAHIRLFIYVAELSTCGCGCLSKIVSTRSDLWESSKAFAAMSRIKSFFFFNALHSERLTVMISKYRFFFIVSFFADLDFSPLSVSFNDADDDLAVEVFALF